MSTHNIMSMELLHWEASLVLQALAELEQKWKAICNTTTDEDEQADYANDLVELQMTKDAFQKQAIAVFGEGVVNFDRSPL